MDGVDVNAAVSEFAAGHGGLAHPAHDSAIEIGGYTHYVRRSIELHRAIEQAFGPLRNLMDRLEQARVTVEELIRLVEIILHHAPEYLRPGRRQIEAHITNAGMSEVVLPVFYIVMCLFLGNRKAAAYLATLTQSDRKGVPDENPTRAA